MNTSSTQMGDGQPSTVKLTEKQFYAAKTRLSSELISSLGLVNGFDTVYYTEEVKLLKTRLGEIQNIVDQLIRAEVQFK